MILQIDYFVVVLLLTLNLFWTCCSPQLVQFVVAYNKSTTNRSKWNLSLSPQPSWSFLQHCLPLNTPARHSSAPLSVSSLLCWRGSCRNSIANGRAPLQQAHVSSLDRHHL